jgi:hypothetical protein
MELHCYKKDMPKFEKLGFMNQRDDDLPDDVCRMIDEQANYAHCDGLEKIKAVFFGAHGAGSAYNGQCFVCDGKRYAEIVQDIESQTVVRVHDNGAAYAHDLREVRKYGVLLRGVLKRMGLKHRNGVWGAR